MVYDRILSINEFMWLSLYFRSPSNMQRRNNDNVKVFMSFQQTILLGLAIPTTFTADDLGQCTK